MECKLGHLEEGDIKTQGGMRQNVFPGFMEFRAYDQSVKLSVARCRHCQYLACVIRNLLNRKSKHGKSFP